MASLLPLIHDLLPMIMPSSIHITKGSQLLGVPARNGEAAEDATSQAKVIKKDAIVNKSDRMCASVMVVKPKASSPVHHNGEQDSILYVASGTGVLLTSPKDDQDPERHALVQGDFAFVPCWTEHQAVNESEEDLVWIVIRGGARPLEVDLTDWGGDEIKKGSR